MAGGNELVINREWIFMFYILICTKKILKYALNIPLKIGKIC